MICKHLQLTFRNLRRNLVFGILVLLGLVLGITTFLSSLQWSLWHLSFDRDFKDSHRIYRLTLEESREGFYRHSARVLHGDLVRDLVSSDSIPGVEKVGRLSPFRKAAFRVGEITFYEEHAYACDASILDIFSARVLQGDRSGLLTAPNTAVLTASIARKYFGAEDPTGREIELLHQFEVNPQHYTIRAVIEDFPGNSHLDIDILTSIRDPLEFEGSAWSYLMLEKNADPVHCLAGIRNIIQDHFDPHEAGGIHPVLQPLQDIHLHSQKGREIRENMPMRTLVVLLVTGILVFLLSWFNFTLLTIGQNQLGIKKLVVQWQMGGGRTDFFRTFLLNQLVAGSIACLFGILIAIGINRPFIRTHFLFSAAILLLFMIVSALISSGFSTGRLYRHLQLSHLGGRSGPPPRSGRRNLTIRTIIILEFIITFVLVSNLFMLERQTRFVMEHQLGSQQPGALHIRNLHRSVVDRYLLFRDRMLESPAIQSVTASMEEPTGQALDANRFSIDGTDEGEKQLFLFPVEEGFTRFYDLEIIHGRDMPLGYDPADSAEYFLLNETAARMISADPESLVGRKLDLHFAYPGLIWPGPVVGIVEDFHLSGLHRQINPMVIFPKHTWLYCFSVLPAGDPAEARAHLEAVWKDLFPDFPLEYQSSRELIATLYGSELEQIRILGVFTILSVLIAGLGLFALSGLFMQHRMKSAAIRKIHGAAIPGIIWPELLHYLGLALFSSALAVPASLFLMERWLRNFHYRIALPVWVLPACAAALVIFSWLSVLYHSIRLSKVKPVEFLREQ